MRLLKLVCDPQGKKVLGVQVVGEGATELIHVGQIAILAGWEADAFVDNVFNFPTLAEVTASRRSMSASADPRA